MGDAQVCQNCMPASTSFYARSHQAGRALFPPILRMSLKLSLPLCTHLDKLQGNKPSSTGTAKPTANDEPREVATGQGADLK